MILLISRLVRGYSSTLLAAVCLSTAFACGRMLERVPPRMFFDVFLSGVSGVPVERIYSLILSLIHCINERFGLLRYSVERIHVPSYLLVIEVLSC